MTVYTPTGMEGNAYNPALLDTCFNITPVASFKAVTLAPATTAPELSKTVPLIRDVDVWPTQERANPIQRPQTNKERYVDLALTGCLPKNDADDDEDPVSDSEKLDGECISPYELGNFWSV